MKNDVELIDTSNVHKNNYTNNKYNSIQNQSNGNTYYKYQNYAKQNVNNKKIDIDINIGSKVNHPKFGNGTVNSLIGKFYEVKFDDGITRVIQGEFLKLLL